MRLFFVRKGRGRLRRRHETLITFGYVKHLTLRGREVVGGGGRRSKRLWGDSDGSHRGRHAGSRSSALSQREGIGGEGSQIELDVICRSMQVSTEPLSEPSR